MLVGLFLYGLYSSWMGPNERIRVLDMPESIPVSTEVTFKLEFINLQEDVEYHYAIFIVSPSCGTRDLLAKTKLYRPKSEFEGVLTESTYSHEYVHEAKARLTSECVADDHVFSIAIFRGHDSLHQVNKKFRTFDEAD